MNDLIEQIRRISKANGDYGKLKVSKRTAQALEAYNKYRKNIEKTDTWKKDHQKYVNSLMAGRGYEADRKVNMERKYPQNVYMGLSNG